MAVNVTTYAQSMSHHLVGVTEIAAMLGVSQQRASQIIRQDDFPPPEAELAQGKVWSTNAVTTWIRLRPERKPGRPRKTE